MKIAIPTSGGLLCSHFGHCDEFTIVSVDNATKSIQSTEVIPAPKHEPGLLPRWLHGLGAELIIAGGMGSRAQQIFAENNVEVMVGAPVAAPEELVKAWLADNLVTGQNNCDH